MIDGVSAYGPQAEWKPGSVAGIDAPVSRV